MRKHELPPPAGKSSPAVSRQFSSEPLFGSIMEKMALLGLWTTLVSLVVNFKQLRDGGREATLEEFRDWLHAERHEQLAIGLAESSSVAQSIEALLGQTRADVLAKLSTIETAVGSLASRIGGMEAMGSRLGGSDQLSDQAIELLRRLDRVESGRMLYENHDRGVLIAFLPVGAGAFKCPEPRFMHGDMVRLLSLGWLQKVDSNGAGSPILQITRAGSRAAALLKRTLSEKGDD